MTRGSSPIRVASHIHLERGDEGLLRDVDFAELPHFLFALLLLSSSLRLRVAAVALGGDVLTPGARRFLRRA